MLAIHRLKISVESVGELLAVPGLERAQQVDLVQGGAPGSSANWAAEFESMPPTARNGFSQYDQNILVQQQPLRPFLQAFFNSAKAGTQFRSLLQPQAYFPDLSGSAR